MADGSTNPSTPSRTRNEQAERSVEEVTLLAERAVLASALLDAAVAPLLPTMMRASDFMDPRHTLVFESIGNVLAAGLPLDIATLAADLRARERLNTVGGAQYLGELTDDIPTTAHVEAHARIVREAATTRRVADKTRVLQSLCARGASMDEIERAAAEVAAAAHTQDEEGLCSMGDAATDVIEHLERMSLGRRATGVTTGFRRLDRLIGRFRPGQLIVIGARPAMGKSALTEVMAICAALEEMVAAAAEKRAARPVIFFSLEMPRLELAARAMAYLKQVDLTRIVNGRLTQDELARVFACTSDLARLPFKIYAGAASFRRIRSLCLREKARSGGVLSVYIDYVQLVETEERSDQNRERELSAMTRGLKLLAGEKQLGCPIVVDAQLNRDLEKRPNKRPIQADLRETGALEQDADVVLFVYRDEVYNKETEHRGRAEIIVSKQRNGPPGMEMVGFHGAMTTFYELPGEVEEDDPTAPDATFEGEGLPEDPSVVFPGETASLPLAPERQTPEGDDLNDDGSLRW